MHVYNIKFYLSVEKHSPECSGELSRSSSDGDDDDDFIPIDDGKDSDDNEPVVAERCKLQEFVVKF